MLVWETIPDSQFPCEVSWAPGERAAPQSCKRALSRVAQLTFDDPVNSLLRAHVLDRKPQVAGNRQGCFVASIRSIST